VDTEGAGPGAPAALRIAGESRAGTPAAAPLAVGEAFRISTGAAVPEGADAVVRVEDTEVVDGRVYVVAGVEPGRNIRRAAEDVRLGETVLRPGAVLGAAELGVLVSVGRAGVSCTRRPRVCVVSTGDELLGPDEPMRPGGVRNSNAYTVPALASLSGAEVVASSRIGDDRQATVEALGRALDADLTVVCGGVSVGEHDHVRPALLELGVTEVFWGVALRPGKPTWFGVLEREDSEGATLVFGLPGNPVSAMVTFILFARPSLLAMTGLAPDGLRTTAILAEPYEEKRPGRAHAVRCRLKLGEGGWEATPTGPQGSHVLTSMLGADALAFVPSASGPLAAGERVEVELLQPGLA
jgi:molybdopterin molybdotransferase